MQYEDRITIATPEGVDVELALAGVGSRFVAATVDWAIRWALIIALGLLLRQVGGHTGRLIGWDGPASVGAALALFFVLVFAVQFVYDVAFETLASGRTPGKRWTGLRVVGTDGHAVGFLTSCVRNLLRIVDWLPAWYAVGAVAVLASTRNQRLGDMAAGTLVVRERRGGRVEDRPLASLELTGTEWATWDVSSVTAVELATVRRFLERRPTLTPESRERLSRELATRLRPKVVCPDDDLAPEAFLERLAGAKAARG